MHQILKLIVYGFSKWSQEIIWAMKHFTFTLWKLNFSKYNKSKSQFYHILNLCTSYYCHPCNLCLMTPMIIFCIKDQSLLSTSNQMHICSLYDEMECKHSDWKKYLITNANQTVNDRKYFVWGKLSKIL